MFDSEMTKHKTKYGYNVPTHILHHPVSSNPSSQHMGNNCYCFLDVLDVSVANTNILS